jgi:hypothetical protein
LSESNLTRARSAIQEVDTKSFHPRQERPIVAALPYGYQIILFLRRARRDVEGRPAESISRFIDAQKAICQGLARLSGTELTEVPE